MSRLHIAMVSPGFPRERTEPGLAAIVDTVEQLAATHDVDVVALRHPPTRQDYELAGARVRPLGGAAGLGALARARVLREGVSALRAIHRERPIDVIHALWADEPGAVGVVVGRLLRRPVVVSVMGGELVGLRDIGYGAQLGRGGRWTSRLALNGATVVTSAAAIRHQTVRMPLGVDLDVFRANPGARENRILFVGSLEPVKDPALALRAFASAAEDRPELQLDVIGEGSLRSELERLATELRVKDRVRFLGWLPREALPELYRSARALLVSSRHEGQSMVAVEAVACGAPVVGTRVGILPDLGEAALTVPVGDQAALALALAAIVDDDVLWNAMSEAAARVRPRYDITKTTAALAGLYERLVTSREPG